MVLRQGQKPCWLVHVTRRNLGSEAALAIVRPAIGPRVAPVPPPAEPPLVFIQGPPPGPVDLLGVLPQPAPLREQPAPVIDPHDTHDEHKKQPHRRDVHHLGHGYQHSVHQELQPGHHIQRSERPEDPAVSQGSQRPLRAEHSAQQPGDHHSKIDPVPLVRQIRRLVAHKPVGRDLQHALRRESHQKQPVQLLPDYILGSVLTKGVHVRDGEQNRIDENQHQDESVKILRLAHPKCHLSDGAADVKPEMQGGPRHPDTERPQANHLPLPMNMDQDPPAVLPVVRLVEFLQVARQDAQVSGSLLLR
mmetsp:Transcript_24604/g.62672  ORF Transcript_24604/g.62672 Transcript_24604/m.62672 type:complete len:305 (-) Transcript_24604:283-1197(-)